TPCSAIRLGQATIRVAGADLPARPNIGLLTQPLSFVGLPVVTVPVRNGPMPIGVQLIAPPGARTLPCARLPIWNEPASPASARQIHADQRTGRSCRDGSRLCRLRTGPD